MRPTSPYHQVNELWLICSQPAGHDSPDRLDRELSMGADPSSQPEKARELLSTIEPGWDAQDPPPQFERYGEQFQPPLYCAANTFSSRSDYKGERLQMITSLLRHGCDLYQEFPQGIYIPERYLKFKAPFPGEDPPRTSYPDRPVEANSSDWEEKNGHPRFSDDECDNEEPAPAHGARHLIHAIIEDGIWFKPLMDYPRFLQSLDLEHRDPQGRTLLLSACRSAAGADILAGTALVDVDWRVENGEPGQKFYPDWDRFLGPSESDFSEPGSESLIEVFLRLGADPLAVDNQEKNALHHLLVEVSNNRNAEFQELPIVRRSLRILSSRYQSLVDQPDHHGTYPLHAALRRMRLHPLAESHTPVAMAESLGCVEDLIRAGADPRAKDRKGNTALHYLADDHLTALWCGEEKRGLFYDLLKIAFCDDINMRNNAGKTVAELILDDDGHMDRDKASAFSLSDTEDLRGWSDVDTDVLEALDEAGYDWKAKTSEGGNLLHIVARSGVDQYRLILRSRYLVKKGIDANEPDADGWTARKIAEHYKLNKVGFYAELERLEKGEVEEYWRW